MIRKLKNILKSHDNNNSSSQFDVTSTESISSSKSNTTDHSKLGSPKMNFIKRKLKSTKSWVRPKHGKYEDSLYDCVLPEPADEFECYTKTNYMLIDKMGSLDSDYGFNQQQMRNKVSLSKLADTESINYRVCSSSTSYSDTNQESYKYFKIIQKLTQSSLNQPANVPILCLKSFNTIDSSWNFLSTQLTLKQSDFKLIILNQGEPVNAMFYSSDLDLIYVRTADDLEGFVPRTYCKILSQNDNHFNEYLQPVIIQTSNNVENNCASTSDPNDSIKYHSLSASEYDDLNEEHVYSNIVSDINKQSSPPQAPRVQTVDAQTFLKPITNSFKTEQSDERRVSNLYQNKRVKELSKYDTGYRSEDGENMTNFSTINSHTSEDNINIMCSSPSQINKHLYQSRSRLPINLELLDDRELDDDQLYKKATFGFENFTYKTSPSITNNQHINRTRLSISATPKSNKNSRRSLDPSLTSSCYSNRGSFDCRVNFFRHNFERNNSDLDLNKIELDSIHESCETLNVNNSKLNNCKLVKKHWRVVFKHEARTQQELSVEPGMNVLVIRENNNWLYIKLIQEDQLCKLQRYGFIPRSCAIDLDDMIHKNEFINCSRKHEHECNNKPQITAL